jgi:hypothetical protein
MKAHYLSILCQSKSSEEGPQTSIVWKNCIRFAIVKSETFFTRRVIKWCRWLSNKTPGPSLSEEVRRLYPDTWVHIQAIKSHTEDDKKYVEEVAVIRSIQNDREATKLLVKCKGDTLVYHTSKPKIVMNIVRKPLEHLWIISLLNTALLCWRNVKLNL